MVDGCDEEGGGLQRRGLVDVCGRRVVTVEIWYLMAGSRRVLHNFLNIRDTHPILISN